MSKWNKVRSDQRKRQTGQTPAVKIIGKRQVVKTPTGPCRDKEARQ